MPTPGGPVRPAAWARVCASAASSSSASSDVPSWVSISANARERPRLPPAAMEARSGKGERIGTPCCAAGSSAKRRLASATPGKNAVIALFARVLDRFAPLQDGGNVIRRSRAKPLRGDAARGDARTDRSPARSPAADRPRRREWSGSTGSSAVRRCAGMSSGPSFSWL